jgi:hypothetical protein
MTLKEFNEKWSTHLEEGYYGLDIDVAEVVDFVDEQFMELNKAYPWFTYSQIKLKFASARVYLSEGVAKEWADKIEEGIERILWERENYK